MAARSGLFGRRLAPLELCPTRQKGGETSLAAPLDAWRSKSLSLLARGGVPLHPWHALCGAFSVPFLGRRIGDRPPQVSQHFESETKSPTVASYLSRSPSQQAS